MENNESLIEELSEKSPPLFLIMSGFVLSIISLIIFGKLADEVLEKETISFDVLIINWLHSFNQDWLWKFMFIMTEMGSVIWITTFSILIIYWLYYKKKDLISIYLLLIVVAGGSILNYVLKQSFHRARPLIDPAIGAIGFSFPSGHSMGSMVFYGFCGYLVINSQRSKTVKYILSFILILFVILIGVSRIYLNAHYPSDVIAGYSAGLIWLILCISALKAMKMRQFIKSTLL